MNFEELYYTGCRCSISLPVKSNASSIGISSLRKIQPDYQLEVNELVCQPVFNTINLAPYLEYRTIPLNSGDLVLSLFNVSNNQSLCKQYVRDLSEQMYHKHIELEKMIFERNYNVKSKSRGVAIIDHNKLLSHYLEMDNIAQILMFYQSIASFIFVKEQSGGFTIIDEINYSFDGNEDYRWDSYSNIVDTSIEFNDMYGGTTYHFKELTDAIYFDIQEYQNSGLAIKKCENCGSLFIPVNRSDEKYCYYPYNNGKTCKEVGYENKLNKDDVLKTYRTIYKTQNARKQRNSHISNIDIKFKKWAEFASALRDRCQNGEITLENMKDLISSDSWLRDTSANTNSRSAP